MATQAQPLSGTRRPRRARLWLLGAFCVVLVVCTVLFLWLGPAVAVRGYLVSSYKQGYTPEDVKVRLLVSGIDTATLRVTARFAVDPDYGNRRAAPDGAEYSGVVRLLREDLRWVPAEGFVLSTGATYGFFNGAWTATDPQIEQARGPEEDCG